MLSFTKRQLSENQSSQNRVFSQMFLQKRLYLFVFLMSTKIIKKLAKKQVLKFL